MEDKKYDIFVSYSRADIDVVTRLVGDIHDKTNARCWVDWKGVESGDLFVDVIMNAIDKVDTVLFVLSDNSMASEFARKEIDYARNTGKKIIPVVVDGGKLRGWFLFHFGAVDYIDVKVSMQYDKLLRNIGDWYGVNMKLQESVSPPVKTVKKNVLVSQPVKEDTIDTGLKKMLSIPRNKKGLLCLVCTNKKDKSIAYFTGEEWNCLSNDIRSLYAKTGVSICKDGHSFIIAPHDCRAEDGGDVFMFGGYGKEFVSVNKYRKNPDGFIATGCFDTKSIVEQCKEKRDSKGVLGTPAAESAWNYKANEYDTLQWYLPTVSELQLIYEHKDDINAMFGKYISKESEIKERAFWSSTPRTNISSWGVSMAYGHSTYILRHYAYLVRAVSVANIK